LVIAADRIVKASKDRDTATLTAVRIAEATVNALVAKFSMHATDAMFATRYAAEKAADAMVRAARYQARAIRVTSKPEPPPEKTVFQQWLESDDAKGKTQEDVAAVEAAMDYVLGDDTGSEMGDAGTPDGAKALLDEIAGIGWHSTVVEAARKRLAGG
jgi:hypothetical protein